MKRLLQLVMAAVCICGSQLSSAQNTIRVFDTVLFYDGYAGVVSAPVAPGIIRHRNDLFARKITDQELQSIGTSLTMKVYIKAACDNYDRIGNINLALVPKGAATYKPDSVKRIEIGRFITPFMNKNRQPDTVPYEFSINNVALLLKETSITANFDIWAELQVFGVPYAANTQVSGCAGRNDVFYGTMDFITNSPAPAQSNNVLIPLGFQFYLNKYQATATDTVGKTTKSYNFNVPNNLTDAELVLITSNHGANANGEEYNRRMHYAYFDNNQVLNYRPGSLTCEPFRRYNTQGNGIYGSAPQSDAQWQSFSNWCPGDVIPIRRINLGPVSAGNHSFMLRVPDAVFANNEGYFPLSVYLQGKTSGTLSIPTASAAEVTLYPNPVTDVLSIKSPVAIAKVEVFNLLGQQVLSATTNKVNLASLTAGVYAVHIHLSNNQTVVQKVTKQ
jgi:hypothetical protein